MKKAIKDKVLFAYELGAGSEMEQNLIASGKIRKTEDGYELFSQEAVNGKGQMACSGDFFKVDGSGYPYPNARSWFLDHHIHVEGDTYRQVGTPVHIWKHGEPMNDVVQALLDSGRLRLNDDQPQRYYEAELWGTLENAPQDAILLFYSIERDENGAVTDDTQFNFVARDEFERDYRMAD